MARTARLPGRTRTVLAHVDIPLNDLCVDRTVDELLTVADHGGELSSNQTIRLRASKGGVE